jgi:hypothetical protein
LIVAAAGVPIETIVVKPLVAVMVIGEAPAAVAVVIATPPVVIVLQPNA